MMNNYLQILEDSLKKKLAILEQIEEKSQEQALMLRDSDVSLQQIDENMDAKARLIEELTAEMRRCASHLEFERAAYLRDRVRELREENEKNG